MITANTIGKAYREALLEIIVYGKESAPRGMKTLEIIGARIKIEDLRANILATPVRDLNFRFMVAEWLWIEAGRDDVKFIEQYNKNITQFSDDGEIFNGAYGPRLAPQWAYVLDNLSKPDSRQAIAIIWTPSPQPSKDIPCTISFQFLIRDGMLHVIATMRSSDAWLGLPYDIYNFSQIANGIAGHLGVKTGSIVMQLGSLHLYENNWEKAKILINSKDDQTIYSPALPGRPDASRITKACMLDRVVENMDNFHEPWRSYVRALRAKNKAEAKEILNATSNIG